jgi:hypothetical protein
MTEYTLTVPTKVGYKIADYLTTLARAAGGVTMVKGHGSWFNPSTKQFDHEDVQLCTYIVDYTHHLFVQRLNAAVAAMHDEGEHTVLVRRLSGRGLVHFFLTRGEEVPLT